MLGFVKMLMKGDKKKLTIISITLQNNKKLYTFLKNTHTFYTCFTHFYKERNGQCHWKILKIQERGKNIKKVKYKHFHD